MSEMDEEKLEISREGTVSSKIFDETDFSVKQAVPITEVTNSNNQQYMETWKLPMPAHEEFQQESKAQVETTPVLLSSNSGQKEGNSPLKEISINSSTIRTSTSLTEFCGQEVSKCKALSNTMKLPQDKPIQKSSSCSNIEQSVLLTKDTVWQHSSCKDYNNICKPIALVDCEDIKLTCNDDEDALSNSKSYANTHEIILPNNTTVLENANPQIQNGIEATADKQISVLDSEPVQHINHTSIIKDSHYAEGQTFEPLSKNTRVYGNAMSRPTLVDDSRLVKISLPTSPMNIMQSNAQFLNKSRNFLNFITEKSTNIMEKALLPQHLSMKYNSMLKSIDNVYGEKKFIEESCTDTESCATDLTTTPETELQVGRESTLCALKSPLPMKCENSDKQLECKMDLETENTPKINIQTEANTVPVNVLITNKDNNRSKSCPLKPISEPKEGNCVCKVISEVNGNEKIAESNEISKENFDSCTFNTTGNNLNSLSKETEINNTNPDEDQCSSLESPKQSLLQHPAYLTLLRDYTDIKAKSLKLQENIEYLEEKNRTLEAESKGEIFATQIETLEKTVDRLTVELRSSVATQDILKKEYHSANKERESMVMKYAVSEKQLIDAQRARDCAERKVKEIVRDQDLLQNKLRQAQGERTRICNILDGKCREVTDLQKEVEKLKEDVKMRDVKLKWTQNKLKTEMDVLKETQQKLDKATTRINEMKEECDQVRKETQESMRKFQQSEENKAVTLDQQLKEQQARLIMERHVTEDKEMLRLQLQKEVELLQHRQQVLIEENNTLSLKIQDSEKSRLNCESNLSNLKIIADQRQKEIVDLSSKVSELETLKLQLQHKDQCLASTEAEMKHLQAANEELQSDMSACRKREADMLDFTQKLTDKNVRLQSEFSAIEAKAKQLEEEHGPLHVRINELCNKVKTLEHSLAQEEKMRREECEILAKHLAEQTQLAQNLAQKLEDSQGENAVLKRKQQISMKEMTRELQQCRKRLEAFETASPCNSLDVTSRTGSNVSLNTGDTLNGALSDNSTSGDHPIQTAEPSRQALIDRIIRLQKSNFRKAEKLEFFEEHSRTLLDELQKKTRIIQNYILHENFGAMGSNERDRHKAELARHGGIMASVYNQRVSDDNMTLELSLEINQKLQAVLEDALLKNITLKDNIDTLGEEIARLTMQNQQKQIAN